jgi:Asp-tRNA(Asn)/Glu-tRNA(Gln) amidotransferase A subunit family amidase
MAALSDFQTVDDEVAFAGAARAAELVRAKEVSPSELVDLYLKREDRAEAERVPRRPRRAGPCRRQASGGAARLR